MGTAERNPTAVRWLLVSVVGIVAWVGTTIYVAATHDDPSTATAAVLRTFAIGGAVFFTVVFVGAALEVRGNRDRVAEGDYRQLAVGSADEEADRTARQRSRRTASTYLVFGALVTGLLLLAIGWGEDGPYQVLLPLIAAIVGVWAVYGRWSLRHWAEPGRPAPDAEN